jgi:hypothetical protein
MFFFQVRISHVLHVISICDLFTGSPSLDLKVCDDGMLIQLSCFRTLSSVLFLRRFGDWIQPAPLGQIHRTSPYLRTPAPT